MPWPLKLIFNTDGHWIIKDQERWEVEDIVKMIPALADCDIDAPTTLVGIDDDLPWRGSHYSYMDVGQIRMHTAGQSKRGDAKCRFTLGFRMNDAHICDEARG